ncbi:MAG: hypothetical protein LBP22_10175 [Deltaproteobacteria bacterium]|jgi:hypothetical protein|nr:hypothetical protein [Deltaproteobacteria bacterium]
MIKEINKYKNCNFIITCKSGSQKTVFDYVEGANLPIYKIQEKTGDTKIIKEYRCMTDVPIRDIKDAVNVHYIELKETVIPSQIKIERIKEKLRKNSKNRIYQHKESICLYYRHISFTRQYRNINFMRQNKMVLRKRIQFPKKSRV